MANKRARGRRRGAIMPWVAALALLGVALWVLLANVVFVVRDVEVVGAGEVPEADVRHLSGIRLGARINALDEDQVRLEVEGDGRLAFVSMEKRLPSRVVLTVRPRTKDALIFLAGKILVLDSDGYVVEATDKLPGGNAVYVTGFKAAYYTLGRQLDTADGRVGAMKAVLEALKAQNAAAYVSELNVANIEALTLITRTGMTVQLGSAEGMQAKIAWMVGALSDLEARGQTAGQLDVSSGTKADYRPPAAQDAGEDAGEAEEAQGENHAAEAGDVDRMEVPQS